MALRDPELDKRFIAWCEEVLNEPALNIPTDRRHLWAQAMVKRYGGTPTAAQWTYDPIVGRLTPSFAGAVRPEILRFASEMVGRPLPN